MCKINVSIPWNNVFYCLRHYLLASHPGLAQYEGVWGISMLFLSPKDCKNVKTYVKLKQENRKTECHRRWSLGTARIINDMPTSTVCRRLTEMISIGWVVCGFESLGMVVTEPTEICRRLLYFSHPPFCFFSSISTWAFDIKPSPHKAP